MRCPLPKTQAGAEGDLRRLAGSHHHLTVEAHAVTGASDAVAEVDRAPVWRNIHKLGGEDRNLGSPGYAPIFRC